MKFKHNSLGHVAISGRLCIAIDYLGLIFPALKAKDLKHFLRYAGAYQTRGGCTHEHCL